MFSSLYRQFRCSTLTSRVSGSFSMFFNAIIRLKSNEGFLKEVNRFKSLALRVWNMRANSQHFRFWCYQIRYFFFTNRVNVGFRFNFHIKSAWSSVFVRNCVEFHSFAIRSVNEPQWFVKSIFNLVCDHKLFKLWTIWSVSNHSQFIVVQQNTL